MKEGAEALRRVVDVLSSAMIGLKGRLQKEGLVIHVTMDKVVDYTQVLRGIGGAAFPHPLGPGDGATHRSGPDPHGSKWQKSHDGD